ncbi:hypothetical protein KAW50_06260 [candidate division WOR-3 bacterium]|nr:hypothetical protein [candidate division WOR-3 bacterium]
MELRQAFLKAMRRECGGYIPKDIALYPSQVERFKKEYGHSDIAGEWKLPIRNIELEFCATTSDFFSWLGKLEDGVEVNEWGIGLKTVDRGTFLGQYIRPLQNIKSVEEILEYPFPRVPGEDAVLFAARQCTGFQKQGFPVRVSTCPVGGTIFWPAYKLRGMENFLCDLHCEPDIATALLDKVCELCTAHAGLSASTGADIIHMADDFGTQISTYVSPADFRKWFKLRLAGVIVIAAAKQVNPDILVHFHSDGAIQAFIPDLIEIGVDILNPVQQKEAHHSLRRTFPRVKNMGC